MKINSKFQIKMLLDEQNVKIKELARILSEKTGKKYTSNSLSQKLSRSSILYDEMLVICEILGYEIEFKKLNKNKENS